MSQYHTYNQGAVDAAIAASKRAGRRVSRAEAVMIHRLLRGRRPDPSGDSE